MSDPNEAQIVGILSKILGPGKGGAVKKNPRVIIIGLVIFVIFLVIGGLAGYYVYLKYYKPLEVGPVEAAAPPPPPTDNKDNKDTGNKDNTGNTPSAISNVSCAGPTGTYTFGAGSNISQGNILSQCQGIKSGNFQAVMQSDGNFTVYDTSKGTAIWSTGTNGQGTAPYSFNYQADGNLVIYDSTGKALWGSSTTGISSKSLGFDGSGNLDLNNASNTPVWSSNNGITAALKAVTPGTCAGPTGSYSSIGSTLKINGSLSQCQSISNSKYQAAMQSDGNLVVYTVPSGNVIWSSGTSGQGTGPYRFNYQSDGNLVVYDSTGKPLWDSKSNNASAISAGSLGFNDSGHLTLGSAWTG